MSARRYRKSRRRVNIANLFAYLLAALLALQTARFVYDWFSFGRGHQAFLQGDCFTANRYFERVISGWRLADIGGYATMAEIAMAECQVFQEAINWERSGKYSQALQGYLEFLESHPESGLSEAIRGRSTALFAQAGPYELVNEAICTHLPALLEQRLVPQRELNLPELYLSCAHFYVQNQEVQQAYAAYVIFLSEYPEHESGREAEAGLVSNPLACQKPELLRDSPLGARPDFIPRLYYTCGLNYESAGELASAIRMFVSFLGEFPEHRFTDQMMTALARTMVAQAASLQPVTLPQPMRRSSAPGDYAAVTILNGSPYPLRIAFYGLEGSVAELEACPSCRASFSCPTSSPAAEFRLQPGDYQVVIQTDPQGEPLNWSGVWTLENKSAYVICFTGR